MTTTAQAARHALSTCDELEHRAADLPERDRWDVVTAITSVRLKYTRILEREERRALGGDAA